MSTNQTMCSVLIAAIGVMLAWTLFKRFELPTEQCVWLTVFFGIGTIFWYEGTIGTTWALPIVTCAVFLLAMLIELFGANRPLWIGIWGALACLARYDAALAMPVIALLSLRK